eukprot:2707496-Amphidinium_carterae.1
MLRSRAKTGSGILVDLPWSVVGNQLLIMIRRAIVGAICNRKKAPSTIGLEVLKDNLLDHQP